MDGVLQTIKKIIPKKLFEALAPSYHYAWALLSAVVYGFPSRQIKIVAITGTKGKTSTTEFVNGILEADGKKTSLMNTIRFKVGNTSRANLYKMSMPGRMFVQKFIADAVRAKCDWLILEVTSEGIKQFRHRFIDFDAVIFTGLEPEHIESHGSFENYLATKLKLPEALAHSSKRPRVVVANGDSEYGEKFLKFEAEEKVAFHLSDTKLEPAIPGKFMVLNAGLAEAFAKTQNISEETISRGVASVTSISGRVEFVRAGQDFDVVVDYAHTSGSLLELYKTFDNRKKICVLGNTGGGRDKWKRPEMARVADTYCDEIILTNEDPYDEAPDKIIEEMLSGFKLHAPTIIMDRREAIAEAISRARSGDAVLITGKGTDPYIMLAKNKKLPWSDFKVAKEELEKLNK
jgi:UDP-N-acetylmuramoyl-L-alanyl-D-glutamate--2,6-diaminopimelate ligase